MIPRRTLGVAVIAVLPLVAACAAGRNTTTDKERQTPYVAGGSVGSVLVTAASLIPSQSASTDASSSTPTPTPSASASGSAPADGFLVVSIVNRGSQPDQLTGVMVQGASVTPQDESSQALTLPPSQAVTFGDPDNNSGQGNSLAVSGLTQPLTPGTSMPVTFQFRDAGSLTIPVLVRASDSAGSTATSMPVPLTGSYPSASETPEGLPSGG
jgi:copper(I)-binding protein